MFRERVLSSSFETATQNAKWYRNGVLAINENRQYDSLCSCVKMYDVEIPNFYRLRGKGNLFFNPMYKISHLSTGEEALIQGSARYGTRLDTGTLNGVGTPIKRYYSSSELTLSEADKALSDEAFDTPKNSAIADAWSNVDQTELLLAASIGEAPETIAWLTQLVRRFVKLVLMFKNKEALLKGARKLKKMSGSDYTDSLSDLWLEFRYAVRPLIFEAEQAVNALNKNLDVTKRYTARGKAETSDYSQSSVNVLRSASTGVTYQVHSTKSYSARAGVMYSVNPTGNTVALTLGGDKPLATMWELVPFSFIVDWFLNIGNIIATWEKSASYEILGTWLTEEVTVEHYAINSQVYEIWGSLGYTDVNFSMANQGSWHSKTTFYRRTPNLEKPKLPHIDVNLSAGKLLDLATIGRALFKGFLRR
jgi:hypothetical protein